MLIGVVRMHFGLLLFERFQQLLFIQDHFGIYYTFKVHINLWLLVIIEGFEIRVFLEVNILQVAQALREGLNGVNQ